MSPRPAGRGGFRALGAAARRLGGPRLGYVLFTVVAFLFFLLTTLPLDLVVSRALDPALAGAPVAVRIGSASWAFPVGVRLGDVRISSTRNAALSVLVDRLTVRVPLFRAVTGRIDRATFDGQLAGGEIEGTATRDGARLGLDMDLGRIALGPLVALALPPPASVTGLATLHVAISGDGRTTRSAAGEVRGRIDAPKLERVRAGGWTIPDLAFRELVVDAVVREGRVQIKELRAPGDELDASASGEITLRDPLASSTLALRAQITTGPSARPEIRMLTGMLPKKPGADPQAYSLGGTIGAPILR